MDRRIIYLWMSRNTLEVGPTIMSADIHRYADAIGEKVEKTAFFRDIW